MELNSRLENLLKQYNQKHKTNFNLQQFAKTPPEAPSMHGNDPFKHILQNNMSNNKNPYKPNSPLDVLALDQNQNWTLWGQDASHYLETDSSEIDPISGKKKYQIYNDYSLSPNADIAKLNYEEGSRLETKEGNDIVEVNHSLDASLDSGEGDDYLKVSGSNKIRIESGQGNDTLEYSNGQDASLTGDYGDDILKVNNVIGASLNGGDGNDLIESIASQHQTIWGGYDNDFILIQKGKENGISGAAGDNFIVAEEGVDNVIYAMNGNNLILMENEKNIKLTGYGKDMVILQDSTTDQGLFNDLDYSFSRESLDVSLLNSSRVKFKAGHAQDFITVDGLFNSDYNDGARHNDDNNVIEGRGGADIFNIEGSKDFELYGNHKNPQSIDGLLEKGNTFKIKTSEDFTLYGGHIDDTINLNTVKDFFVNGDSLVTAAFREENGINLQDTINVINSSNGQVLGNYGNDTITLKEGDKIAVYGDLDMPSNLIVQPYTHEDTIKASNSRNVILAGGAEQDTYKVNDVTGSIIDMSKVVGSISNIEYPDKKPQNDKVILDSSYGNPDGTLNMSKFKKVLSKDLAHYQVGAIKEILCVEGPNGPLRIFPDIEYIQIETPSGDIKSYNYQDIMNQLPGNNIYAGSQTNKQLKGTGSIDTIVSFESKNTNVKAGAGDDIIWHYRDVKEASNHYTDGEAGHDVFYAKFSQGLDIRGGEGNDTFYNENAGGKFLGGAGVDTFILDTIQEQDPLYSIDERPLKLAGGTENPIDKGQVNYFDSQGRLNLDLFNVNVQNDLISIMTNNETIILDPTMEFINIGSQQYSYNSLKTFILKNKKDGEGP